MDKRTYLRMLIYKVFINNSFIKTLLWIVNFYYNLYKKIPSTLKFKKSMPIKYTDMRKDIVFLSITGDRIDCTT